MLVLARTLPIATFGQISVLTAIFVLTSAVAGLGMEASAFRGVFTTATQKDRNAYYAALVKITTVGPLLLACAVALIEALMGDASGAHGDDIVLVVSGACAFAAATTCPLARFRAESRTLLYVTAAVVPTFVQVVAKFVLCAMLDMGSHGWALGDLIGGISAFAFTLRFQYADLTRRRVSSHLTQKLLLKGVPLVPHVVSSWVLSLSDRLLIAALVGNVAVGKYGLAAQLSSVGIIVATELNRAISPAYGRVIADPDAWPRLARVVSIQRLLMIPLFVGTALAGSGFIYYLAPDEYEESLPWCLTLCAGLMVYAWYYPPMNVLSIIEARTALMPLVTITAGLVNVVINLSMLRQFGPVICAQATVAGYLVLFALTTWYAGRHPALAWTRLTMLPCLAAGVGLYAAGIVTR